MSGSGAWFYDTATQLLYADMETTLGAGDPATADVIVPNSDPAQAHVYFYADWYIFKGLTIRGSGASGIWGYGSHVTVESCNIKFNGKGAVSFQGPAGATDDAVLTSLIYFNVLINWPRGNNDFVGGGWPSGLGWYASLRPLARGNIVHRNGGEGVLTYGTQAGATSGSALFEQNVVYDNWSVNVYIDNQPNGVIRNNFIFDHPADLGDLLYQGDSYWTADVARKLTPVGVMLADEEWSSDATNHYANLANTAVYDNVLAGNRVGIRDYAEGLNATAWHGLKNTTIANNTIILPQAASPDYDAGIEIQDKETPSGVNRNLGSTIANNIIYGFGADYLVWSRQGSGLAGIAIDHNVYSSASATPFAFGDPPTLLAFTAWKASNPGLDSASLSQDPLLVGATNFGATVASVPVYDWRNAEPAAGSPARDMGLSFSSLFSNDFRLAPRPQGAAFDAGAFELVDIEPAGLTEDAHATGSTISNVNKVLEPGETILVNPSWRNLTAAPLALTGTASAFTGPAGATYTLIDTAADYGTIAPGASADSFSAGGPSYRVSIDNPGVRPAAHWDATFLETLSDGITKTWTLHIGQSFTDVPVGDGAYPFVESLLHNGITAGCVHGSYCPGSNITRWQMAVFLVTAFKIAFLH